MDKDEFKRRTKMFAIAVAKFCRSLPFDPIVRHYVDQIVRCSASVGANYRAACRAKSKPVLLIKCELLKKMRTRAYFFRINL